MDGRQERIRMMDAENFQTYADFVLETLKCTGREFVLSTQGSCMSPLIEPGDRLVVRLVDPHKVKFGDIITFHADNRVFAHRYIKKKKENGLWLFCQKGDRVSDWNWIPETQVIGKVEKILKGKSVIELSRWNWVVANRIRAFGAVLWIVSRTVYHLLSNSIDRLRCLHNALFSSRRQAPQSFCHPGRLLAGVQETLKNTGFRPKARRND